MAGKADIVGTMAEEAGITKKEATAAYEALIDYVSKSVSKGERVAVPGLGSFSVSQRAARTGRNPRTNEAIKIPASKSVRFKAGKDLRDSVNKKRAKKK
jgi:DNA-binding protein HU-beta